MGPRSLTSKRRKKYDEITNNTLKIAKILDEVLFEIDIRFKKLNWKLFNDYHYFLKGPCEAVKSGIKQTNSSAIIVYPADDFENAKLLDLMYA